MEDDAYETGNPTRSPQEQNTHHSETADDGTDDSKFAFEYGEENREYDNTVFHDLRRILKDLERVSCTSSGTPGTPPATYLVHRYLYDEELLVHKDHDIKQHLGRGQEEIQEGGQDDKATTQPVKIKAILDWEFAAVFPDELFYDYPPRITKTGLLI